jgi:hypothetical protein
LDLILIALKLNFLVLSISVQLGKRLDCCLLAARAHQLNKAKAATVKSYSASLGGLNLYFAGELEKCFLAESSVLVIQDCVIWQLQSVAAR